MSAPVDPPVLDEANAAFVTSGVMTSVSSRDARLVPSLMRALACRVAPDRRRVTVLLLGSQAGPLLEDLRATGAIAVVFSQPSTHRTIQIKGVDAVIEAAAPGDTALVAAKADAVVADMVPWGYTEQWVRGLFACDERDLVAVGFTPSAAFAQTPGPQAGRRL